MTQEELLEKIASSELTINPHVLSVVERVRQLGLHKTAAALQGHGGEVGLRSAVGSLGARLVLKHARHAKIAAAIDALNSLEDTDI